MEWKEIVLKFYRLKSHGLTFKGNKNDYVYVSEKKAVGVITEKIGDNIFTIAFFPSMKNDSTFIATINFNRNTDFIIPTYESLLKFANYIVQRDFQPDKTIDLGASGMLAPGKHLFHEKLAEMYRQYGGDKIPEYDMLLLFICRWLGLQDVFD